MSRKLLIIVAVAVALLATLVVPATAASLDAEAGAAAQTETGFTPSGSPFVWPLRIHPNGECESGGAGGCPIY